ncbi:MAG: endonuclease MutS2 [Mucilaginibacter polytrichastri]|nr:endonuclease MutS2 [Mucilaginibacter polytrichastri]
MFYPENALEKLGFGEIKNLIKSYCLSPMGQAMVEKIQPQTQFEQIDKFLRQANEFKSILENDEAIPIAAFFDLKSLAAKARIEGSFLSEEEFFQIRQSLATVFAVIGYFEKRGGQYPNLEALFEHLPVDKDITRAIDAIIDPKGKMKHDASAALRDINTEISRAEQEARRKIDQIYRAATQSGWTADGSLTVRDGRLCIPVLAENKRKLKGFIHDESASGQTVFIEPEEVFSLNNRIRDLEFERRREMIRILTELTTRIRPSLPLLISYHGLLTKLDFVRAKALFAQSIEATMPGLKNAPALNFINASHPLLYLNFRAEKRTVVPLNIRIDEGGRIIVVSGPNAGGKSVCLKTVGLLQVMVQSGLLIPAAENSEAGVFKELFVDIGDDQSLESDLSTYSAHLTKMKHFVEESGGKTLVLIDEFGTGTDPQFGGPIAEAVLEALNRKHVRGVITTHYSNLKIFAANTEGIENASMLFDNRQMKPMYILEVGKPGSSYAFEIAEKTGLPVQVMQSARNKVGAAQKRVDTLLVDLEREKRELMDARVKMEQQQKRVVKLAAENEDLRKFLDENRKTLIREAKDEARLIIQNANKLVENTIAEIRQSKADKEKTRALRANLQQGLDTTRAAEKTPVKTAADEELKVGDWVKINGSESSGQVIDLSKDNVIIAMGELRTVAKKKNVEKVAKKEVVKSARRNLINYAETAASFSPEIDVRGLRGENALYEIEKYLDKALMMGFSNLKIIHGKGDGILRKMIREYLRKYDQVERMEDEHQDRGGDGITYVYLR